MRNALRMQPLTVIAVAAIAIAALTGCSSSNPTPRPTVMSAKAAGAYYLTTTCKVNAQGDLFAAALDVARQSSASTGPDLDNLKSATAAFRDATQTAAHGLDHPRAAWPASVRQSVSVIHSQYLAELPSLEAMMRASQMSDAAAGYSRFPDSTKAAAATKRIRSKLGLPPITASNSCPPPPALSVAPATGVLVTGTGYSYHAPAGWTIPKDAPQADSYAISAKPDTQGVYDTVNVLIQPTNRDSLVTEEQQGVDYLEQAVHATAIQVRPHVEIAGAESIHISSLQTRHGITLRTDQYLVTHDGADLYVTFDFNAAEPQPAREALAESVLGSWAWT
jgi:hypothetical protein